MCYSYRDREQREEARRREQREQEEQRRRREERAREAGRPAPEKERELIRA